jgi:UDP-N-acetylmuramate--alanine ligase
MTNIIETAKHVHFIGIGGIGISALARFMVHDKRQVSGTNDSESPETLSGLREKGVTISLDLNPAALPVADVYIYSDAWLINHPEVIEEAKRRDVPVLSYFEALGQIANQYYLVAVSGAHGKTTTTAMLIDVLEAAGLDPTAVVGSLRAKTKSNFRAGKSKYFIVEADEYRRHFLQFSPDILVITNVDADHLDYYKDLADIQSAFRELAERTVQKDGYVVTDGKSERVRPVAEGLEHVIDYTKFVDPLLTLKVPGMHNLMNAGAVLAVADLLKIKKEVARSALMEFSGTWRRFEYKGKTKNGALVYDDYAHHPAEIVATLKAARELFPENYILVAFQPHLYSRTKLLFNDFAKAFSCVNEVLVAPIFKAREVDDGTVSHQKLSQAIAGTGTVSRAGDFEDIEKQILSMESTLKDDLVIITMGAGELYQVADRLTQ